MLEIRSQRSCGRYNQDYACVGSRSMEPSSSSENSELEIKIKTLDSNVFTCRVEQNISITALKEQIASLTGVSAESQRLIYRGKVLKDDQLLSTYNIENEHTLHLVTRPAPPINAPSTSAGVGRGVEDEAAPDPASSSRPGQGSHSVVLGTFNLPDHGDGGMPDVSRIIASVLNSLGVSNLVPVNTSGASVTAAVLPSYGRVPSRVEGQVRAELGETRPGTDGNSGSGFERTAEQSNLRNSDPQHDSANNLHPNVGILGAPASISPQIRLMQQTMVVPDSLTTMSQYLNRMEQMFAFDGLASVQVSNLMSGQTPSTGISSTANQIPAGEGYPSIATLVAIIRRTQQLLVNRATTVFSALASQLENEPETGDPVAAAAGRAEAQSLAIRDGMLMQHLGALLLELGRTTMTVRAGSPPAGSIVNAGPAVFISALGPNPMMVQAFPFQPNPSISPMMTMADHNSFGSLFPSFGANEAPRSSNFFVGELGLASTLFTPPSSIMQAVQTGGTTASAASNTMQGGQNTDGLTLAPLSGSEGVRVLPMRTLLTAVPRPPTDPSSGAMGGGLFYPLLGRLNRSPFAQAVVLNGRHAAGVATANGDAVMMGSSSAPEESHPQHNDITALSNGDIGMSSMVLGAALPEACLDNNTPISGNVTTTLAPGSPDATSEGVLTAHADNGSPLNSRVNTLTESVGLIQEQQDIGHQGRMDIDESAEESGTLTNPSCRNEAIRGKAIATSVNTSEHNTENKNSIPFSSEPPTGVEPLQSQEHSDTPSEFSSGCAHTPKRQKRE